MILFSPVNTPNRRTRIHLSLKPCLEGLGAIWQHIAQTDSYLSDLSLLWLRQKSSLKCGVDSGLQDLLAMFADVQRDCQALFRATCGHSRTRDTLRTLRINGDHQGLGGHLRRIALGRIRNNYYADDTHQRLWNPQANAIRVSVRDQRCIFQLCTIPYQ